MNILSIETSCDETGVCLMEAEGSYPEISVNIVANELASQAKEHQEYGGVYPTLAKRLHGQNLPPLLFNIFKKVKANKLDSEPDKETKQQIRDWLSRHEGLADSLFELIKEEGVPEIDAIAVTAGPGLEPALWVGINVARSLGLLLEIPVIPVNHMEGHLLSGFATELSQDEKFNLTPISFPAVALLVSGGHTELIKLGGWRDWQKVGQTRDDAAGEAFDKVGRLLGLPYPAGPDVSHLAEKFRNSKLEIRNSFSLPRPMIDSDNLDFSFSGLKTSAARLIEKQQPLNKKERMMIAYELETAIVDVLVAKTKKAGQQFNVETILAGGGVSANQFLRKRLENTADELGGTLQLSPRELATDNAIMIGLAGFANQDQGISAETEISADSRLSL